MSNMRILVGLISAMSFQVNGQNFVLGPRQQSGTNQPNTYFAIIYDADTLPDETAQWISTNNRRRYTKNVTVGEILGIRSTNVLVVMGGTGSPLEVVASHRAVALTVEALRTRCPALFPDSDTPAQAAARVALPDAPTNVEGVTIKAAPTRKPYVSRDGGFFVSPWPQLKPGDVFMLREDDGTYVKDGEETEFVATSKPYMYNGTWTIDYVTVASQKSQTPHPETKPESTEGGDKEKTTGEKTEGQTETESGGLNTVRLPPVSRRGAQGRASTRGEEKPTTSVSKRTVAKSGKGGK